MKTTDTTRQDTLGNYTYVKIAGRENPVLIPVTDSSKPDLGKTLLKKWQNIIELMVKIADVPVGLIMKLDKDRIKVLLSTKGEENPYHVGDSEHLNMGLYCETVVGKNEKLSVPDARQDPLWDHNPDIKLGMYSYMGYPISWPDGELYGTICILDNKTRKYKKEIGELLRHFESVIEDDLMQLLYFHELKNELEFEKFKQKELHHRIKNQFTVIISNIQLALDTINIDYVGFLKKIDSTMRTFASIHTLIYQNENISMQDYLKAIVRGVLSSYDDNNVAVVYDVDEFNLDETNYFNLGLILNELITNSSKHAFPYTKEPTISITTKKKSDGFIFEYADNGPGIDKGKFDKAGYETLGNSIISFLPRQMGGKLQGVDYENARFIFNFENVVSAVEVKV